MEIRTLPRRTRTHRLDARTASMMDGWMYVVGVQPVPHRTTPKRERGTEVSVTPPASFLEAKAKLSLGGPTSLSLR